MTREGNHSHTVSTAAAPDSRAPDPSAPAARSRAPSAPLRLSALQAELDALAAEPTPRAAFDRFAELMTGFGFTEVFAGRLSLALLTDLTPEPFAFVNADSAFIADYLSGGYFAHDPICAHMRRTNRPFRWRDATQNLTPAQATVTQAFADIGLTHGLCVPIDSVGGVHGFATLGRGTDFALAPEDLIVIEMSARTLFAAADALLAARTTPAVRLTPREADVLSLVSQGKTNWETGQILGISEYVVRDYMRGVSRRLHTHNRTHTVVRAMQLGLIPV